MGEHAQRDEAGRQAVVFPLVLALVGAASAGLLSFVYAQTKEAIDRAKMRKVEGAFGSILGEKFASFEERGEGSGVYVVRDAGGREVARAAVAECPGSYNASSPIRLLAVLNTGLRRILGVRIVASEETPGLGDRVNEREVPRSLFGIISGAPEKRRVVPKKGGPAVGLVEEQKDGRVAVTDAPGNRREFARSDVLRITSAPFPPTFQDQFTNLPVKALRRREGARRVDAITGATVSSRAVVAGVALAVERLREAFGE